jgi:lysophospholipase L1-like esterase
MCVVALGVMPVVGCGETAGDGGSGGSAGTGGMAASGGTGGMTEPVRVAFIGDSITERVGTSDDPVNYPEHLETLLGDDFELGNFGYGGATMSHRGGVFSYWNLPEYAEAKAFEADIATIMLGTNDTKPQVWDATAFESDYNDMIEELQNLPSNPTIVLLLPVPVFGANEFDIRGDVLRDEVIPIIERLGAEHELDVIDLHTPLVTRMDLFPDNVHPTAEGGLIVAEQLVAPLVAAAKARGFQLPSVGQVFACTEAGIRAAIAEGGGPFTFSCDGPTTAVTEAEIVIDNDVVLDGEGDLTVDGDEDHRVFSVLNGVTAELRGFTVTGGAADAPSGEQPGSGIRNKGTLTLRDSTVSRNAAGISAIHNRGEYDAQIGATLTLLNSTVSDNASDGIMNELGVLALTNSTVSGHSFIGVLSYGGTLTMNNSTTSGGDRGIDICGGVIAITNSTVSASRQALYLNFSAKSCSGSATIAGSLINGGCEVDLVSTTSNGYNIESRGDTCGFDHGTDQVNVSAEDLALGPLADNGGPTMTHALGTGSVAIDVIPADMCEVDEDQRGEPRPGGAMCDVGAFEVQP